MRKTIMMAITLSAALSTSALAADDARVSKEMKWIERTEQEAFATVCRDSNLSEAQKVRLLCEKYNICSELPSCNTVIKRWGIDETEKLKKDPDQYFYEIERRLDRARNR